jgi:hypothetical protein
VQSWGVRVNKVLEHWALISESLDEWKILSFVVNSILEGFLEVRLEKFPHISYNTLFHKVASARLFYEVDSFLALLA